MSGDASIAIGPLTGEKTNIDMARSHYTTTKTNFMHTLIRCYNTCNKSSMVAYPVGMHNDHFHLGRESLEDRILLCLSEYVERGQRDRFKTLLVNFHAIDLDMVEVLWEKDMFMLF